MNKNVRILQTEVLSDNWYTLRKIIYEYKMNDGNWHQQSREAYDRGDGAVILLYNKESRSVILTRQFRMATFLNGNADGMMVEACAGLLDQDSPEDCIRREALEETGYHIVEIDKAFEAYMSPGSVTELIHFYTAVYTPAMKTGNGGGLAHEQEDIEVLEIPFEDALAMIDKGIIKDGKTIMLLQYARIQGLLG
jgi:GDP-mannose pyrophosphatase NudK